MKDFLGERRGNSLQLIIIEKYILYLCLLSRNADTVWLPVVGGGPLFWLLVAAAGVHLLLPTGTIQSQNNGQVLEKCARYPAHHHHVSY